LAGSCTALARLCSSGCVTTSKANRRADYLLPTADVIPDIEIHHMESPTPLNPLGVKGAAESGTIGAPAAIVAAIEDALRPLKVRVRDLPLTPAKLRGLIAQARGAELRS
jgi:aerobic carbon-monoxide dehydrogenase large subunit